MLALNLAHSLSTYLLLDGATCLQRDDAAGGGADDGVCRKFLLLMDFSSTLGVFGFDVKLLIASVRSGLEMLKFSLDFAVSNLNFLKALSS